MSTLFRGQEGPGVPVATKTGDFGEHQWSRRWMGDLEARATRSAITSGRSAARNRWVLDVQIGWQKVVAHVQGSQPSPFEVTFDFPPPDPGDVPVIEGELTKVGLAAALAGSIDDALATVLLPAVDGQTRHSCSCPDQPGPCLHAIAVACVLVERLDKSPQDLFRMRGYPPRAGNGGTRRRTPRPGAGGTSDVIPFWDADPQLPPPPVPSGSVSDLLDGASARAFANAVAHGNTLATLAILSDLEDLYHSLGDVPEPPEK